VAQLGLREGSPGNRGIKDEGAGQKGDFVQRRGTCVRIKPTGGGSTKGTLYGDEGEDDKMGEEECPRLIVI